MHLLDDFALCAVNEATAWTAYHVLLDVLEFAGLPTEPSKNAAPSQLMQFLGVVIDTRAQELSLPPDKVTDINRCIQNIIERGDRPVATKKLQSIAGKLQFATVACMQMRPVLSALYRAGSHDRFFTRVPAEVRRDLRTWAEVLNGATPTVSPIAWFFSNQDRAFTSTWCGDASGHEGFGAWCRDGPTPEMFHEAWPGEEWNQGADDVSSTVQELVPLIIIVLRHLQPHCSVAYETDSAALVAAFAKGRSRVPRINRLLRMIMTHAAAMRSDVRVSWFPRESTYQRAADTLSRGDFQGFSRLQSTSQARRCKIPDSLLNQVFQGT